MGTESPSRPRISKIRARNFKSMEDLELDLSPLTVLVGPNASGKSNIADIPKFFSDAVRDGLAEVMLRSNTPDVRRTSALAWKSNYESSRCPMTSRSR